MNGKIDVQLRDTDENGVPDEAKVTITIGKTALVLVITLISSALGYTVI